MQANNAYDENGMPLNLEIRANFEEPKKFMVWFTNLPDVKYFADGVTWVFFFKDHLSVEVLKVAPKTIAANAKFSDLPKQYQHTVLHYYRDTFGAPGEPVLS